MPLRTARYDLEECQGHLRANDRRRLQQVLLLGGQAVKTRRQDSLYCGWHLNGRQSMYHAIGSWLTHQHPSLHQCAHALLQEEGIPLCALDQ